MDDAGRGRCISYDNLVIATGAVPAHPPSDGLEQKGVLFLRTMGGGFAVRDYLVEQSPASAVVVGGGYIGLEIAEALNRRGVEVTLVEYLPSVLTKLDPPLGRGPAGRAGLNQGQSRQQLKVTDPQSCRLWTYTDCSAKPTARMADGPLVPHLLLRAKQ